MPPRSIGNVISRRSLCPALPRAITTVLLLAGLAATSHGCDREKTAPLRRTAAESAADSTTGSAAGSSTDRATDPRPASRTPSSGEVETSPGASAGPGARPATARLAGDFLVDPAAHDFGPVGHGESRSIEFEVTNTRTTPIRFAPPRPSCSSMTVSFDHATPLGPAESRTGTIEVVFGRALGKFDKHVDLMELNKPGTKFALRVRAHFHPGLALDPRSLTVHMSTAGPYAASRAELSIGFEAGTLDVSDVEIANVRGRVKFEPKLERVDDRNARIVVSATAIDDAATRMRGGATTAVERTSAELRFRVAGRPVIVPVTGRLFGPIVAEPDNFVFSVIKDPTVARREVVISAADGRAFDVTKVEFRPGRATTPASLEFEFDETDTGWRVVARPALPAPNRGSLLGNAVVHTSHPGAPTIEIPVIGTLMVDGAGSN